MCEFAERMEKQGISKGISQGISQGISLGKIASIFELLEDLGPVPEDIKERITAERDEAVLTRWHKLAAKSDSMKAFSENM